MIYLNVQIFFTELYEHAFSIFVTLHILFWLAASMIFDFLKRYNTLAYFFLFEYISTTSFKVVHVARWC